MMSADHSQSYTLDFVLSRQFRTSGRTGSSEPSTIPDFSHCKAATSGYEITNCRLSKFYQAIISSDLGCIGDSPFSMYRGISKPLSPRCHKCKAAILGP